MKRAEPGWLVLVLAGVAAAIGSLLPFYTFSGGFDLTVWSRSLFPTAALIPLLLFGIALEAMFVLAMGYEPRSPFLNFTWSQARLAGSAFSILLALSYLVQGRAGGSLGSGYLILSLSTVASFGGAVMTRRAELARGREEIVEVEHPWRAAVLRWRGELAEKMNSFASDNPGARVQPAPDAPNAPTEGEAEEGEQPAETPEEPVPEPTPVPRLSAVQSEPEPVNEVVAEEETEEKAEEQAEGKPEEETDEQPEEKPEEEPDEEAEEETEEEPEPAALEPAKRAAAKKTLEKKGADSAAGVSPTAEGDAEGETEAESEVPADDEERERPAAPG